MRPVFRCVAVAIGLASSLALAPTAQAADPVDTAGPQITVSASPNFMLGQSMGDAYDVDHDGNLYFWGGSTTMEYRWTASDPSDICRYTVDEEHGSEGWVDGVQDYETNATSGRHSFKVDGMENSDDTSRIRINAWDCAGNKSTVERRSSWTHMSTDYGPAIPSGWAQTSCTCFIGDSVLRTTTKNAAVTTTLTGGANPVRIALVMAKGPARGKAAIYYDGALVKTVDTYAAVNTNRVVVWDGELRSGQHTVKVVNLATSGRSRIDVDALVSG